MKLIVRSRSSTRWVDERSNAHVRMLAATILVLCFASLAQSDSGSYDEATRLYRNRTYVISCKVPAGWVVRTEQMKADDTSGNQVLLAAFERPPEASGPAPASTILIASESQSNYPGLKAAEDYFAPLTEVVTAKGFKAVNDSYAFKVGTQQVVREDFSREQKDRPTTYQSTLVTLAHGQILSFTFLAASEDDVDSLIENLALSAGPPAKPPVKTTPKISPKSTPKTARATKPN